MSEADPPIPTQAAPPARAAYPTLWQGLVLLLLFLLFCVFFGLAVSTVSQALGAETLPATTLSMLVGNSLAAALVLFYGIRKTGLPQWEVLPTASSPKGFLVPLLLMACGLQIVGEELARCTRHLLPALCRSGDFVTRLSTDNGFALMALIVVAPLFEELLFRGLMLHGFLKNYGARKAIVASAVLFAVMHLDVPLLLPTFVMGALLGWVFHRARSLIPCLFVHAVNNAIHVIVSILDLETPGSAPPFEGVLGVPFQLWWLDLASLALLIGGIGWFARVARRRERMFGAELPEFSE